MSESSNIRGSLHRTLLGFTSNLKTNVISGVVSTKILKEEMEWQNPKTNVMCLRDEIEILAKEIKTNEEIGTTPYLFLNAPLWFSASDYELMDSRVGFVLSKPTVGFIVDANWLLFKEESLMLPFICCPLTSQFSSAHYTRSEAGLQQVKIDSPSLGIIYAGSPSVNCVFMEEPIYSAEMGKHVFLGTIGPEGLDSMLTYYSSFGENTVCIHAIKAMQSQLKESGRPALAMIFPIPEWYKDVNDICLKGNIIPVKLCAFARTILRPYYE
jgi:hypothetical protein